MKNFIVIFTLAIISLIISSCSFAGIQHYYKPIGNGWVNVNQECLVTELRNDSALYEINNGTKILKVNGKDSIELNNIIVQAYYYKTNYAMGFYYVPLLPDLFSIIFISYHHRFSLNISFNVKPYGTNIKTDEIRFYINGDSTISHPIKSDIDHWYNIFYYSFNIKTTEVKNVKIEFKNVTINGVKIDIPDLVLKRGWRFYNTMNWAR